MPLLHSSAQGWRVRGTRERDLTCYDLVVVAVVGLLVSLLMGVGLMFVVTVAFGDVGDPVAIWWAGGAGLAAVVTWAALRRLRAGSWGCAIRASALVASITVSAAAFLSSAFDAPLLPYVYCTTLGLTLGLALNVSTGVRPASGRARSAGRIAATALVGVVLLLMVEDSYTWWASYREAREGREEIRLGMTRDEVRSALSDAWCVEPGGVSDPSDRFFFGSHYLGHTATIEVWYAEGPPLAAGGPGAPVGQDANTVPLVVRGMNGPNDRIHLPPEEPDCLKR